MAIVSTLKFTDDLKRRIVDELNVRGANKPCPRCGNGQFALLDGIVTSQVHSETAPGLIIGLPTVPSAVAVCAVCGFLSQHALGVLGLLSPEGGQPG